MRAPKAHLDEARDNAGDGGDEGGAILEPIDLARQVVDAFADKLGEDILLLDISGLSILADFFVIGSASTERQAKSVIEGITGQCREKLDIRPLRIEGEPSEGWTLIDYGSVVVHLFSPEARRYYRLEDLWRGGRVVVRVQ